MAAYTYPRMVKYSCHIVFYGQLRKGGWHDDHGRFRKVLREDELCPSCERRHERVMCRTLHWLQPRTDFAIQVVHPHRPNGHEIASNCHSRVTVTETQLYAVREGASKEHDRLVSAVEMGKRASGGTSCSSTVTGALNRPQDAQTNRGTKDRRGSQRATDGDDIMAS